MAKQPYFQNSAALILGSMVTKILQCILAVFIMLLKLFFTDFTLYLSKYSFKSIINSAKIHCILVTETEIRAASKVHCSCGLRVWLLGSWQSKAGKNTQKIRAAAPIPGNTVVLSIIKL